MSLEPIVSHIKSDSFQTVFHISAEHIMKTLLSTAKKFFLMFLFSKSVQKNNI